MADEGSLLIHSGSDETCTKYKYSDGELEKGDCNQGQTDLEDNQNVITTLWYIAVILMIMAPFRLGFYITYTTETDTNNCTDAGSTSQSNKFFYFSSILSGTVSALHFFEALFLLHGIYLHFKDKNKKISNICCCNTCSFKNRCKSNCCEISFSCLNVLTTMTIYILLAVATPTLRIITTRDICYTDIGRIAALVHTGTMFVLRVFSITVRIVMILQTIKCRDIWKQNINNLPDPNFPGTNPSQEDKAREINLTCMENYHEGEKEVVPVYKVFSSWFVIQWILYVIVFCLHIGKLLQLVVLDKAEKVILLHIYYVVYILYDALSVAIPFGCGLKMNSYAKRYAEDLQKKQELAAGDNNRKSLSMLKNELRIKKRKTSEFVPRIPGTGLNIPLRDSGFFITVVFVIVGLVASVTSF